MKKIVAYILGISLLAGSGYCIYKTHEHSKNAGELKVYSVSIEPTATPKPTYEPTFVVHNLDGTIDFHADINYLNERNPETTPEMVLVYPEENGDINFKIMQKK